jgi:uncharacterized protein (TIGR02757 family)
LARIPRAILSPKRARQLRPQLEQLVSQTSLQTADPVRFVRRYSDPADAEVAAVFASTLAFGRVAAFMPVIEAVLLRADARGGPARWVDGFDSADERALEPIRYRWLQGADLGLLARSVGRLREEHGSLEQILVQGHRPESPDIGETLDRFLGLLRQAAVALDQAPEFSELRRGFRHGIPLPSNGSGCKRWNMMLRWMVRRPAHPGDPDLGLWDLPAHKLIIPVDTHVLRVAKLLGLTHRTDGSWRTAAEITANLARIHPSDPVRYDFALAHLGISGTCKSRFVESICGACPLRLCCRHGRG